MAQTLGLLHLFPVIFFVYFVLVYALTMVFARVWPVSTTPDSYVAPESPQLDAERPLLREAWERALSLAANAPGFVLMFGRGFRDGLVLASTILGSILTVGTTALLVARETPLFDWLGLPLVPVLHALGLPDAELVAPAALAGICEMYIPALLVRDAALPARFFVAVLSISQLIFFSAVGPMMLDMFQKVPIRARELVAIFLMRTAILIPAVALVTRLIERAGMLAGS